MLDSTESLSENSGLSGSLLTKFSLKSASASVQSLLSPQSTELSQSESLSSLGLEIVLYQREKKGAKAFQLTEASFITSIVARVPSPIEWDKSCYSYVGLRLFASGQNVILVKRTCLLLKTLLGAWRIPAEKEISSDNCSSTISYFRQCATSCSKISFFC